MDCFDNYSHIHQSLIYVVENTPEPLNLNNPESVNIHENFNQEFSEGCSCINECMKENCSCIQRFEENYERLSPQKATRNFILKEKDTPIYECHINCSCFVFCGNRLVQHGPIDGLQIKDFQNSKGLGLITTEFILKNTFICEYVGEVISQIEARERYKNKNNDMNYVFCLNEYLGKDPIKTYIDPTHIGNIARYINHCCEPNCVIVPVRVNNAVPKLCIFASRDISPGEEISFDYGNNTTTLSDCKEECLKPCLCLSMNCKKYLPFNSSC